MADEQQGIPGAEVHPGGEPNNPAPSTLGVLNEVRKVYPEHGAKARAELGVMLPGVDPIIGEIVLTTMMANPAAHPALLAHTLVQTAPNPGIAVEFIGAVMELVISKYLPDGLVWVEETGGAVLTGIRRVSAGTTLAFGASRWPMTALAASSPQSVTVRSSKGLRRVWMASDGLEGTVVRQSEAIAIGNAFIERFGGRIVEDRSGPAVLQKSYIEQNMTKRARLRAQARAEVEKYTIRTNVGRAPDEGVQRVAIAEALPGKLESGDRITPIDKPGLVYVVERRINESWVLVSELENTNAVVNGGAIWIHAGTSDHAGFSEEDTHA